MTDQPIFVSASCKGERCFCGAPAIRKVGEEIFSDDPYQHRHNLTRYVCGPHFAMILGPAGARQVGLAATPQPVQGIEAEEITIELENALQAQRFEVEGDDTDGRVWLEGYFDLSSVATRILSRLTPIIADHKCFECNSELHAPFCPACNPEMVTEGEAWCSDMATAPVGKLVRVWTEMTVVGEGRGVEVFATNIGSTSHPLWKRETGNQVATHLVTHWRPLATRPTTQSPDLAGKGGAG